MNGYLVGGFKQFLIGSRENGMIIPNDEHFCHQLDEDNGIFANFGASKVWKHH